MAQSKFTPKTVAKLLRFIKQGNYKETAARLAGISRRTLTDWIAKGEAEEEGDYRDFVDNLDAAMAFAEAADLKIIENAAKGKTLISRRTTTRHFKDGSIASVTEEESYQPPQWQAAAWRRERMQPLKFGRRTIPIENPADSAGDALDRLVKGMEDAARASLQPETS